MKSDAVGVVLAGGRSARMGRAKALVELAGAPLIMRSLAALADAGLEAVVVAKPDSELPELAEPVLREPQEPRHPLLGIATALSELGRDAVVTVPCDMPFVPPALLGDLAGRREPLVVCEGGGRLHPLLGRYGAGLRERLLAAVEAGAPAQETVTELGARVIDEAELSNFGPPERVLFNVNDEADLAAAEQM